MPKEIVIMSRVFLKIADNNLKSAHRLHYSCNTSLVNQCLVIELTIRLLLFASILSSTSTCLLGLFVFSSFFTYLTPITRKVHVGPGILTDFPDYKNRTSWRCTLTTYSHNISSRLIFILYSQESIQHLKVSMVC